ncbi:Cytochrome P450 [Streptomyces davaonensis JCM 4913]|uniref:Cytochrome P450 n=1 Tax=Streptomyces davaonensis (strain DSM 101723 / JCM 4913 / KCC S-0913 / 768) TaxID=1214101 RepID=K4QTP0_STRDJ|nr:cytochrome P450 [Streptomyces davaonensis]CCK26736.1 Cytochrome P450 [Streptomyces davaonensis JCM 4913]
MSPPTEIDTPSFLADQHGYYAGLRETPGPRLVRNPQGLGYWLITRHADARAVLLDPRFSKDPRLAEQALSAAGYGVFGADSFFLPLVNSDPPDHTRLRRLVSGAFTPRRVEELRPRVERLTHELLDAVPDEDGDEEGVDLMAVLAFPLPVLVISELLGVPHRSRGALLTWATRMLTVSGNGSGPAERTRRLHRWFASLVAAKRPHVRRDLDQDEQPDLLAALVVAHDQGQRLDDEELVGLLVLLLVAGHETTTGMIGNAVDALLRHPDQLALLRDRPELLPSAVDELLRYEASLARTTLRVAREDVKVADTVIPAGSVVSVALSAANRDPEVFPEPDRLDITRARGPHLSFGHGIHFCLGAPLARLQTETVLAVLLHRFPELAAADPEAPQLWRPVGDMRGLLTLPVRLRPAF